jgi:glycosyltransferase involved in cell wall biosynthesis
MRKKNIDVVVKYFYPVTAGIETNVLETYSVLAKKGWNVTIHTSRDIYMKKNVLPDEEVIRGLRVKRYPFNGFGFFPDIDWQDANLVCLHNFDIFPHFRLLIYSILLKIVGKKKFSLVLTPHGGFSLDTVWFIFPFWKRVIKRIYHNMFGSWLINYIVDGVRAVSEWEKKDAVSKGVRGNLITVIPNGVENEAYGNIEKLASKEIKSRVRSWGRYIIRVGRIYPIKNDETVIRALPFVPKDIKFIIVGPQELNQHKDYLEKLRRLIKKLKLTERVIFTGVIRGVDKYYVIKKSQTMVHMALWESFCNVVHEALSQGKVPIVANNTALPYLIKNEVNGYLVETKDYEVLAKRIQYLLKNKNTKKLRDMAEKNREFGLEESWDKVATKMDKMYQTLL